MLVLMHFMHPNSFMLQYFVFWFVSQLKIINTAVILFFSNSGCCCSCIKYIHWFFVHVSAVEMTAYFMHRLSERVAIQQATSTMIVTTMPIIPSQISLVVTDNHFSGTTIWIPPRYARRGISRMFNLPGPNMACQILLRPLGWLKGCLGVMNDFTVVHLVVFYWFCCWHCHGYYIPATSKAGVL